MIAGKIYFKSIEGVIPFNAVRKHHIQNTKKPVSDFKVVIKKQNMRRQPAVDSLEIKEQLKKYFS